MQNYELTASLVVWIISGLLISFADLHNYIECSYFVTFDTQIIPSIVLLVSYLDILIAGKPSESHLAKLYYGYV